MRFRSWIALALLATPFLARAAAAQTQTPEGLSVRAVRSYRVENGGQTRVRVLIQVPLNIMDASSSGVSYEVAVKVADQAGVTLNSNSWRQHLGQAVKLPGAYSIDMLDFAVPAGTYKVAVQVTDSVSGKVLSDDVPVEAYATRPDASDVILASVMKLADATDSVPKPGEMRKGNTVFDPAALLRLTALHTEAYYILEAYTAEETAGTMAVQIVDGAGAILLETQKTPVKVASGGGLLKGGLNLEGLPQGNYTLKVVLTLGTKTVERSAPLMMAPLEETLQKDVARINFEKESDEGYFKYMSPEALDSAFAPLFYIAEPNQLKAWNKSLSDDAKRKFLTDFWVARDPSPNTPRNETREQFYAAVDFANKNYRERTVPGWKTDRGRIYAKMGAPQQALRRAQIQRAPPYEVWSYPDQGRWYIFADATGVGNWKLLISSDVKEAKQPDWRDRLTEDGVRDSGRFLNVDFYAGQYKSY